MYVLERCPSYRESNKESKERQGQTLDVCFTEVGVERLDSTLTAGLLGPNTTTFTTIWLKFQVDLYAQRYVPNVKRQTRAIPTATLRAPAKCVIA